MDPGGLAIAIIGLLEGLPGSLDALRGLRAGPNDEVGPSPAAAAAYLAFEKGAAEMLLHMQLIVGIGVPPSIKGGLWSYPVVYRSHRAMIEAMSTMVVAFGQMVMLGTYEVNEAGFQFAEALADVTNSVEVVHRRIRSTPTYEAKLRTAQEAMRNFLLAARADLAVPGKVSDDQPERDQPTLPPGDQDEGES